MSIDFKVDRTRFPYEIFVDGSRVAVIYSTHLLELLENVVTCNDLVLQYALRVNRLISIVEGRRAPDAEDLIPAKEVRYSQLALSDKEVEIAYGFRVGQRYKTGRAQWVWEIVAVFPLKKLVKMAWVQEDGELSEIYRRDVTFDTIAKYVRIDDVVDEIDDEANDEEE